MKHGKGLKTSLNLSDFLFLKFKTAVKCRSLLLLIFDSSNEGLEGKEMEGWNRLPETKADLVLVGYSNMKCF